MNGDYALRSDRKPPWLRVPVRTPDGRLRGALGGLHTVCQEARCPNKGDCFSRGTATFLLMGDACTRNCRFCSVRTEVPEPLDGWEPERVARAVAKMELDYVVLTSVTRDDLKDGGAGHFAETVRWIRKHRPSARIEVLIPDFGGDEAALGMLVQSAPEVVGHNMETVPRRYPTVRPGSDYRRSLEVLRLLKHLDPNTITKSAMMVGLGEREEEVHAVMHELREVGCNLLVIGQYLQPTPAHLSVVEYIFPEQFQRFGEHALHLGFAGAHCHPLARSSHHAEEMYEACG
ncbi:MAG: lipoyl synthase [Candidatus Latescibacterota bacterium]